MLHISINVRFYNIVSACTKESSLTISCIDDSTYDREIRIIEAEVSVMLAGECDQPDTVHNCTQHIPAALLEDMKSECEGKPVCGIHKYSIHVNKTECLAWSTDQLAVRYTCDAAKQTGRFVLLECDDSIANQFSVHYTCEVGNKKWLVLILCIYSN